MSFFKKISDTVSKGVTTATEKAQQTVEITKLNSQISSKRKEIDKLFALIGESVYESHQASDLTLSEAAVKSRCDEITAIRDEIALLNDRIKAIRNEKDCVCGKRLPEDTRFCPSCGNPFPAPAVEKTPIQVDAYVPEEESNPETTSEAEGAGETNVNAHTDQRQTCKNCGTPLYADSHYCPACGQPTR